MRSRSRRTQVVNIINRLQEGEDSLSIVMMDENGGQRMEDRGWRMEDRGWKSGDGG